MTATAMPIWDAWRRREIVERLRAFSSGCPIRLRLQARHRCEKCGRPPITKMSMPLDQGELVARKAVEALPMKLQIGNRAAFLAHARLAEGLVSLELLLVLFALHDVALR